MVTTLYEYQSAAAKTAVYPDANTDAFIAGVDLPPLERLAPLLYLGCKISGEAGEVSEMIGKALRDGVEDEDEWTVSLVKELGDVLWYVNQIASEIGVPLQYVAQTNIDKLEGRVERGTLHGSGDNR